MIDDFSDEDSTDEMTDLAEEIVTEQVEELEDESKKCSAEEFLDEDLFQPEERFPPQFHLDYLERELPFNLGEVDEFQKLDWETKCELAEFAVDHDLDLSSTQEVIDAYLAYHDDGGEDDTAATDTTVIDGIDLSDYDEEIDEAEIEEMIERSLTGDLDSEGDSRC